MIYGITYADDNMTVSAFKCALSMEKNGVDRSTAYTPATFEGDSFHDFNHDILKQERGGGYWAWKPFVIYRDLLNADEGDILIYSDAGVEFVANVNEIISRMDEDIFFFTNGFPHVEWCKGDVLKIADIKIPTDGQYQHLKNYKQVQASVIFFRVNQKTRDFVKEWLLWCQMPGFIDDSPSKTPNYPTFAEHRHDQAVLTSLQIKYGYKLHFWPTHYSEHIRYTAQPEDRYPTMFNHHRKRNDQW